MENSTIQPVEYWQKRCGELENLVELYKQQILLMQHRQFGAKSEKHEIDGQIFLFNEAEEYAAPEVPEPEIEEITYERKKRKGKREEDLSGLPVERIEYELSDEARNCPECGEPMCDIGA